MAECQELASDALVTPKWVLPGQPQDQLAALGRQLRLTRTATVSTQGQALAVKCLAAGSRVVKTFLNTDRPITFTYINRAGRKRQWTAELVGANLEGPVIRWQGQDVPLCPWSKLIAVEDCREEVAGL